ncbi:MAG: hypothetical protein ACREUV_04205 [Burkholderiales bacterium]
MIEMIEEIQTTEVAEYRPTAAALAELKTRLANVAYDVSTGKGMEIAKKDRAEVRGLRVALEAKRVEIKAPALEHCRMIDAEAKALTAELLALETPIDQQIKSEETRKAVEKAAKEQAEREAAAAIQTRINFIREFAIITAGVKADSIHAAMQTLADTEITLEEFGDRAGEAAQAKAQTLAKLAEMQAAAEAHEAEQVRMAEEREELARQRAEQEATAKAERERIAAEQKAEAERLAVQRREQEAKQAELDKQAEAQRAEANRIANEAFIEANRKAAVERAAEQKKLDDAAAAERERLDKIAAEARAQAQRIAEEQAALRLRLCEAEEAAQVAGKRLRDAAPAMLSALKTLENDNGCIPAFAWKMRCAAIELATGEKA